MSYKSLLEKSDCNPNWSLTHYPNKHEKAVNYAASPKDPIIRIKNEWNEKRGKPICSLDLSIFCYLHAFWDKGAGNLQKILQEDGLWLHFSILE